MRVSRFFIDTPLAPAQHITLPPNLVNYIVNALRLDTGNNIILFNGLGGEFNATLIEVKKRSVLARINFFVEKKIEPPLIIRLFQGISRSDRMDFTIQKAVELGVSYITPVFTERTRSGKFASTRMEKKVHHWQGVAISACEQSGRTSQVKITPPIQLKEINDYHADLKFLLAPDGNTNLCVLQHIQPESVNIFIGPEGGLSSTEIKLIMSFQYQKLKLGPRILRTETAGLAALSVLQFIWGDLA